MMNKVIWLAVAGMLIWGVWSLTHVEEGWESEQGWFLTIFGLAVGVVNFIANRRGPGK